MSDFRYAPIYGRNPWLMVEDADEVADFFRNSGTPFVSHRRDIVHFGSQPHVYWIESGLVASSATTDVDKVRWIGLFSRRTLLGSVVRTLVFVLCFLVLTLLLRLVTGGIDKVLDLPVLNALNTIGGGALGLIEGALLLFLICDVAPKLGVKVFADYEGTYLLSFFMSHTPRGLVAALLP